MALQAPPDPIQGVIRIPKPPEHARRTGEVSNLGAPIYEETVEAVARTATGRPIKDRVIGPDGNEVWEKHPTTGVPLYPRQRIRREKVTRRFVLHVEQNIMGIATGSITKNYHFEPDPAERDRLERVAAERSFQDQFAAAAVERGLTVDQLLDQVLGKAPETAGDAPEPATEEVSYPRMVAPGKWALTADHEARWRAEEAPLFQGTKKAAEEAASKLGD